MAKSQGTTPSEQYVASLCDRTFLSLWSYPNVYRDQRAGGKGAGKELCDLIVVCGNDVVLFSVKSCAFPDTGVLTTDWTRWYDKAISNSARQLYGAQRWVRDLPDRLYLDSLCQSPFPISLPAAHECKFHLIVVALGAKARCQRELQGSGSLILQPAVTGEAHRGPACTPFHVGDVNVDRDFIHVLDDVTLNIVLRELDTITDFLDYLNHKKEFIRAGKLALAAGEENLLAYYLSNTEDDRHLLLLPETHDHLFVAGDHWQVYCHRPEVMRKKQADRISYLWDEIIEELSLHTVNGTCLPGSQMKVAEAEVGFRIMARESRVDRRMLGKALNDLVLCTRPTQCNKRTVWSYLDPSLAYVFIAMPDDPDDEAAHRAYRREYLFRYCFVLAWKHRQISTVVGIATEAGSGSGRSYDLAILTPQEWTPEDEAQAESFQNRLNILRDENIRQTSSHADEYPEESPIVLPKFQLVMPHPAYMPLPLGRTNRNDLCPCGSGKKYKRCCMRLS